jgi:large subunit ribosomal protein L10
MVKQTKIYEVENVAENIKEAESVALIDYQGLSAQQNTELRKKIRDSGGTMAVTKNTLIKRALAKLGIELEEKLTGPTALVYSQEDAITPLKAVKETAEELESPKFKFGIYQQKLLPLERLKKLVEIPGKDVLLSKLANGLNAPMVKLVNALEFNQRKLVMVLKSLEKKKQAES